MIRCFRVRLDPTVSNGEVASSADSNTLRDIDAMIANSWRVLAITNDGNNWAVYHLYSDIERSRRKQDAEH